MKQKYNYLVSAILLRNGVTEFIDYRCEAYTDDQAVYFLRQKYGYGLRDIHPRRGQAITNPEQISFKEVM